MDDESRPGRSRELARVWGSSSEVSGVLVSERETDEDEWRGLETDDCVEGDGEMGEISGGGCISTVDMRGRRGGPFGSGVGVRRLSSLLVTRVHKWRQISSDSRGPGS